jgi:hypothetical protein
MVVMMMTERVLVMVMMVVKVILVLMKVLSTSHGALSEPGSPLSTVHINLLCHPISFMRFKNNFHASEPKQGMEILEAYTCSLRSRSQCLGG